MKQKIIILLLFLPVLTMAQQPLHYWGKPDSFMVAQTQETFQLVNSMLEKDPPSTNLNLLRKSALLHIDWVMHDERLDYSEPVYQFIEQRIQKVAADLENPVNEGIKVYKLYNHGFVLKTKSVTIAFDLIAGGSNNHKPFIPMELMDKIVEKCDILFISHEHGDHADLNVANLFFNKQKTVVAPTGLWEGQSKYLKNLRSENILKQDLTVRDHEVIKVKIMPGLQDHVLNNVYLVTTPENITIAHTGDQWDKEKDAWIDTVKEHTEIDVLLLHSWAMPLERIANGFNPKLIITGHENELVHSVDHREPYWLNERRMKFVKQPRVYMTWGENYTYLK